MPLRNWLVAHNRLEGLLTTINEQIQAHGLMVKGTTGAVIDATWLKKGKKSYFGYCSYLMVDKQAAYICEEHTAPGV